MIGPCSIPKKGCEPCREPIHAHVANLQYEWMWTQRQLNVVCLNRTLANLLARPHTTITVEPRLKEVTAFDLDDAKVRPLVFTAGYRYLATPGSSSTNRMDLTATHFPLRLQFLLTDRNGADVYWTNGTFKWRYRNRLQIEKPLEIRSYHPVSTSALRCITRNSIKGGAQLNFM
jgi:hypothetical protein